MYFRLFWLLTFITHNKRPDKGHDNPYYKEDFVVQILHFFLIMLLFEGMCGIRPLMTPDSGRLRLQIFTMKRYLVLVILIIVNFVMVY